MRINFFHALFDLPDLTPELVYGGVHICKQRRRVVSSTIIIMINVNVLVTPTKLTFTESNKDWEKITHNEMLKSLGPNCNNFVSKWSERFQSKKISNDQELIQSDPTSCPQNQKGNN